MGTSWRKILEESRVSSAYIPLFFGHTTI